MFIGTSSALFNINQVLGKFSLGAKREEREIEHLTKRSVEVKTPGSFTYTLP
jgi:hypothetical protein